MAMSNSEYRELTSKLVRGFAQIDYAQLPWRRKIALRLRGINRRLWIDMQIACYEKQLSGQRHDNLSTDF